MFLNTCTHCASKSSAPMTFPAWSVASWPAMNSHSAAFLTRVICEYWPSGFPRPSGLKIVIAAGTGVSFPSWSGPRIARTQPNARTPMIGQAALRIQEVNPARLAMLYRREFELCRVKSGETIAVVSDLGTRREYVQAAFAAADDLGADVYELCVNSIPSWTKVGVPTIGKCKGTLEAVSAADMLVIFHVPLFTKWLKQVTSGGTRVLMIIDAPDDLEQLMSPPGLKAACKHAESIYGKTRKVRVTSDAGTDLSYECGQYPVMTQWGYADEPGHFDHWGGGHIHTFPNEGSANGTVVFQPGDIVILPYCRYVVDPVKLEIREGHIVKLEGGMDAKLMRDWLED